MPATIQNRVRELRYQNDQMTQQALADELGVSRQTIIAIESGRYAPSLELALKIARHFGLTVEGVFELAE